MNNSTKAILILGTVVVLVLVLAILAFNVLIGIFFAGVAYCILYMIYTTVKETLDGEPDY